MTHTFGTFSLPKAVSPRPVPEGAPLDHPALYFNQELSWIDFNWRVLALALDASMPLLERVRFVAITAGNLDEFTQKRVGGLKRQAAADVRALSSDGRTSTEQLSLIARTAHLMHQTMTEVWEKMLKPALRDEAGVIVCDYADLTQRQRAVLHERFQTHIFPILTPLAVDPGRPFPFISNLSLSLAVLVRNPVRGATHFARLKVPTSIKRWLSVEQEGKEAVCWVPVEQVIARHVDELFRGMEVVGVYPFRVTRNADLNRDEEEAEDLLALISDELRDRRSAPVVRLEIAKGMPGHVRRLLMGQLGLEADDLYEVEGLLDLTGCYQIADLDLPMHRFRPWDPVIPMRLMSNERDGSGETIFAIMRQGDLLVHHPYDSFGGSVQRLVEEASADRQVLAIKQTIYRTSDESPVVEALMEAARNGKQVAVLVEIKARFDEANNIEWGKMLEDAGVHVTYGLVGLKTHAKILLIVRREGEALRTYCHVGTGNYHPKTARLYTDLGLLTCDPAIGDDLVGLFHHLTGYSPGEVYTKLIVSPRDMREAFYRLIHEEVASHEAHGTGHIIAKMNALDDVGIIQELYRASQAGVKVDLIVRGHSCLRPGLPGFSDNIRLVSILGRFLEHDRLFWFANNGEPKVYFGSADWRRRNLQERVEAVVPVEDPALKARLKQVLDDALADNVLAWDMDAEGRYVRRRPDGQAAERNLQEGLMSRALTRGECEQVARRARRGRKKR
ncbi:MAG: polyphosphate kinase 1 [Anaerolineae bacterium]|nr:polyphosphate kinase 1 [Anaerolineae bacterium]